MRLGISILLEICGWLTLVIGLFFWPHTLLYFLFALVLEPPAALLILAPILLILIGRSLRYKEDSYTDNSKWQNLDNRQMKLLDLIKGKVVKSTLKTPF